MLIKGAMLNAKQCGDSCIHVKKAHIIVDLTKVDSSGGMLPDIVLFSVSCSANKIEILLKYYLRL